MKIHPPRPVIDDNDPFKDALFGRKDFGLSLTSLLRNSEESLVVFVNAKWGQGKTTFSEMWRAHLKTQKLETIYYNAYASDYFDDPFISFSGEILALVKRRVSALKGSEGSSESFKKSAVDIGKKLVGVGVKVGVRAATLGIVTASDIEEIKEIGKDGMKDISEIAGDYVEDRINNYTNEKDSLTDFRKNLGNLAKMFRVEYGFPLTIIVDELDRCRPDFALGLLERIKHLFEVDDVAFVLLVNREQIERYIEVVYGKSPSAFEYLQKFGSIFVDLPSGGEVIMNDGSSTGGFCDRLFDYYGFDEMGGEGRTMLRFVRLFSVHFQLTLRDIEKVFSLLALFFASGRHVHMEGVLIALLAVLKVKRPELYVRLAGRKISETDFLGEIRFEEFKTPDDQYIDWDWMKRFIKYHLYTEGEFNKLSIEEQQNLRRQFGSSRREQYIPRQCAALDRFSWKPAKGNS